MVLAVSLEPLLADYGLVALFAIIALQALGVAGLPGKTSLVVAALLAAEGYFPIWGVVAVAAVAGVFGGYAGYGVGRRGGRPLADRIARGRLTRLLDAADLFFAAHGTKAVFFARFLPGLKVVAAPAAGMARMRWRDFALWHAAGAIGFALVFGLGAYFVGESALALAARFGLLALFVAAATSVAAWLAYVAFRRRRARLRGA